MANDTQTSTDKKWGLYSSYYSLDLDWASLEQIKKEIDDLLSRGIHPKSEIRIEEEYDSCVVNLYEYRQETDDEMKRRIATQERMKVSREEFERKQYEKLKEKYGEETT